MVKKERYSIEKRLFKNQEDALVPIEVTLRNDSLEISSFRKTYKIAKKFEKLFALSPFSNNAISFLDNEVRPIAKGWGYSPDELENGHILTYLSRELNEEYILPSTVMLKSADGYQSLLDYELEGLSEESEECYFATVIDNKIVSACEINTEGVFIGASEINIYTNESYRQRGYGLSNVTAMVKYLNDRGKRVAYTTTKSNEASQRLAEKCGFEKVAETFYYIVYKEE